MSGLREVCAASFEMATHWTLLPPHEKSGRFEPPLGRPRDFGVPTDAKLLAHYATTGGPLYRDRRLWRQGYNFVRAFTTKSRGDRAAYRLIVSPFIGPLRGVQPLDLFDQVCSLLFATGFSTRDRNDVTFRAVTQMTDGCQVQDLPEPYGKWLQLKKRRPRWSSRIDLELEVRIEVTSHRESASDGAYQTNCAAVLTAPAVSLLLELHGGAARLFGSELTDADPRGNLRSTLLQLMQGW